MPISLLTPQPASESGYKLSSIAQLSCHLEPRSAELEVYEEYGPCPEECPRHGELIRGRVLEWPPDTEEGEAVPPRLVLGLVPDSCPLHRNDPCRFVRHVLGVRRLLLYQRICLLAVRDSKSTAVASCHGAGKTYTAALVVLAFISTRRPCKVFTTAPTGPQVKDLLWAEIRNLHANAIQPMPGVVLTVEIKASEKASNKNATWYAKGRAARDGNAAQGWHSPHLLIVYDEATGVKDAIRTSLLGALGDVNSRELAIGNPTGEDGFFREAFGKLRAFWRRLHISAMETVNVRKRQRLIPGMVGHEYIDQIREMFGEGSPYWICRILGRFFNFGEEKTVPPSWVRASQARWPARKEGLPRILLVDPAASVDNDSTGVVLKAGLCLRALCKYQEADTMVNARKILRMAIDQRCTEIRVDITGPTKGIGDKLLELKQQGHARLADGTPIKITCIQWGNSAKHREFFDRIMDEMWFSCRDAFDPGPDDQPNPNAVALCPDGPLAKELAEQLSVRGYTMDKFGKIKVESKSELRKRGVASPDLADAAVMGFLPQEEELTWSGRSRK